MSNSFKVHTGGSTYQFSIPPFKVASAVGIVLLALVVLGLATSVYQVDTEERAVVKRFGAVVGITDPGLRFKLPFGIDRVQRVATARVLKEEFGFRTAQVPTRGRTRYESKAYEDESLMLTGDLNVIDLEWVVQYRINDPVKFLYQVRDATSTLRDISESVMRRVVGNRLGAEVLTVARVEMQQQAQEELQLIMDQYNTGIHIITVELQDVIPPARVQPAFNEVNEARQELERTINEARKKANEEIPRAEGAARRAIAEAEGYADERINRAKGESARFRAVLAEYQQAPQVTRTRLYLETISEVLPRVGRLLVVQEGHGSPLPLLHLNPDEKGKVSP